MMWLKVGCDQRDSVSDRSFDIMVGKVGAIWDWELVS